MELTKIQFEDGQKVSDAYVEINGVKHPVTKAQYQGKTPLSARNLNKMQENMETAISDLDERVVSYRNVLVDSSALIKECGGLKLKKLNKLVGKTEQETREGYNILNLGNLSGTSNGVNYSIRNGKIILNGTLGYDRVSIALPSELQLALNGSYTLWSNSTRTMTLKKSDGNNLFLKSSGTNIVSATVNNVATELTIHATSGTVFNNEEIEVMLVEGTYTANTIPPYEQYGKAPTPNFPSEVKTATGNVEVKVENNNIYNSTIGIENGYLNSANGNVITGAGWKVTDYIKIPENVEMITILNGWGNNEMHCFYNENKELVGYYGMQSGVKNAKIPLGDNYKYVRFTVNQTYKENCMIAFGDTDIFIPHQSQVFPLTLGDIELCKIGDYADYIYRNGSKWFIHKELTKILLKSTDNWSGETFNNVYRVNTNTYSDIVKVLYEGDSSIVSNHFKAGWKNVFGNLVSGYIGVYSNKNIYITTQFTTTNLQGWKDFLDNNDVYVITPLATPTDTEITDTTLIAQLNALENAQLYEGITNITITGDTLTPIADIDYWTWFKGETGEDVGNIYSTEEQVIGKWIDGKPLYRKIMQETLPITSEGGIMAYKTGIVISNVVKNAFIEFAYVTNNAKQNVMIPYETDSGNRVKAYVQEDTLIIGNGVVSYNEKSITMSVLYTKTTD